MYKFVYIKLNHKTALSCTECIHSCAIVWTYVIVFFIFAIIILSVNTTYILVVSSGLSLFFIFVWLLFNLFKIDFAISSLSGSLLKILISSLLKANSFNFLISLIFMFNANFIITATEIITKLIIIY